MWASRPTRQMSLFFNTGCCSCGLLFALFWSIRSVCFSKAQLLCAALAPTEKSGAKCSPLMPVHPQVHDSFAVCGTVVPRPSQPPESSCDEAFASGQPELPTYNPPIHPTDAIFTPLTDNELLHCLHTFMHIYIHTHIHA